MATAKEEKQFAKERAKRLKEKRAAYRAAKKAGTLDARQLSPEHMRYLRRKAVVEKVWPFFRFFIIFGLCFVILYPLIYMISTAFRPSDQMQDPSVIWIPKSLTLDNIKETWKTIDYFWTFLNTVKLNIIASLLQVVTCALTGYGFARFNFKGKKILFAVVIMMIIVPPQIIVIPTFMQFSYFRAFGIVEQLIKLFPSYFQSTYNASPGAEYISLVDHGITMYAPALFANGIKAGLFIYIFRQFFRGLPKELEDSAYLDGCGAFKTFIKVMVPNASSSFLTVFLFSIVWYWNDYYISSSYFLQNNTMALMLQNLSNTLDLRLFNGMNVSVRNKIVWLESGCLLSITPILIMYVFLQRYFTEGIERSGLVG